MRSVSIQVILQVTEATDTSQDHSVKSYRKRLQERGLARFEVLGLATDRKLIRALARRLAEDGPEAKRASGDRPDSDRRSAAAGRHLRGVASFTRGRCQHQGQTRKHVESQGRFVTR